MVFPTNIPQILRDNYKAEMTMAYSRKVVTEMDKSKVPEYILEAELKGKKTKEETQSSLKISFERSIGLWYLLADELTRKQ